ncbi:MAG: sulfotransferase [Phycisphaerales bacterium]
MPDPAPIVSPAVLEAKVRAGELLNAGDPTTAAAILQDALPYARRDPELLAMLADALGRRGRDIEALRHAKLAADLRPHHVPVLLTLAGIHRRLLDIGAAHRALDRVLAIEPENAMALAGKANLLESRGQADKAFEILEPAATKPDANPSTVTSFAQLCRHLKRRELGIKLLRRLLERMDLDPPSRRSALVTLGHLLDSEGAYDEAFEAFDRASKMLDACPADNPDLIIENWSKEALAELTPPILETELPVLIVGMPRSGTTLTEQILCAHPRVATVGESQALPTLIRRFQAEGKSSESLAKVAREYVDELKKAANERTLRVVDKMPGNYAYLGLLARSIRGAKYVHCRRDARDTVLSCFFQDFAWLQPFSSRLETCAEQYLCYLRLIKYWQETTDIELFESRYEDLIDDPEPHTRALIDHVGLEFDPACLEHHKQKSTVMTASIGQVRNPIYKRSRERWRNYEKHIGPMLELLKDV